MQTISSIRNAYLNENIFKALAKNGIRTILEFLQEDAEKLCVICKLSLPQILSIRSDIFNKYSAQLVNGTTYLTNTFKNEKFIRTEIKSLDALLNGGIPRGLITEVCGLPDSGKTQLCFQIAISTVKNTENTVLYIDTKGDFSAVRIQKILNDSGYFHREMALIMSKIKVVRVWSIEEIIDLLKDLKNKHQTVHNLSLVIIDSLPSLMFQFLGDDTKIGLCFLNTLINYIRFLAKTLNMGFICVNIQTRWIDQDVSEHEGNLFVFPQYFSKKGDDPEQSSIVSKDVKCLEKRNRCLGKYWQQIPALVLLLEKSKDDNILKDNVINGNITVLESCYGNCSETCAFKISGLGVA